MIIIIATIILFLPMILFLTVGNFYLWKFICSKDSHK
nr:MAG TPA: hypothetical protein [Bacteriophage sp.]